MPRMIKIDHLKLTGTVKQVNEGLRKLTAGATMIKIGTFEAVYQDQQPHPETERA
jgi:hypothetical protein